MHRMDRLTNVAGDAGLAFYKLAKFEESDGLHLAKFTGTVRGGGGALSCEWALITCLLLVGRGCTWPSSPARCGAAFLARRMRGRPRRRPVPRCERLALAATRARTQHAACALRVLRRPQVRQSQSLAAGAKVLATSLIRAARLQRRAVGKSAVELSALHDHLASMPVSGSKGPWGVALLGALGGWGCSATWPPCR